MRYATGRYFDEFVAFWQAENFHLRRQSLRRRRIQRGRGQLDRQENYVDLEFEHCRVLAEVYDEVRVRTLQLCCPVTQHLESNLFLL